MWKERPFLVIFLRWFIYRSNQLCLCRDWALRLSENKGLKGASRVHLGHLLALFWNTYLKFSGQRVTCSFINLVSFKKFLLFVRSQRLNFIWKHDHVAWEHGWRAIICWICVLRKSFFQETASLLVLGEKIGPHRTHFFSCFQHLIAVQSMTQKLEEVERGYNGIQWVVSKIHLGFFFF